MAGAVILKTTDPGKAASAQKEHPGSKIEKEEMTDAQLAAYVLMQDDPALKEYECKKWRREGKQKPAAIANCPQ